MPMIRRFGAAALLCGTALAGPFSGARACTMDGVPTLTVNGYPAIMNKDLPVGKNLSLWAPFKLSFPLHSGRDEALAEITKAIPLPLEAYRTPWRWTFGDGSPVGRGMAVHHTFRKPGTYKILVEAYFPSHGFWYPFDALQVRVLKGS